MNLLKQRHSTPDEKTSSPLTRTVVCLGDSITRGQVSANYVDLLDEKMSKDGLKFINGGVNNDLAFNVLRRLDDFIDLKPQYVTLLVGTNDILAQHTPYKGWGLRMLKHLPQKANFNWYTTNLSEIIRRIKLWTNAKIGLLSIPVIGEDLHSPAIQVVKKYNIAVRQIAAQEKISYLPVFERQVKYLKTTRTKPEGKAYVHFMLMTGELVAARGLFHVDYETFSRRKGYHLVTDGVHFNQQGAKLIAEEIEKWLRANARQG
jgi:lysophospholipase L1-like esterase